MSTESVQSDSSTSTDLAPSPTRPCALDVSRRGLLQTGGIASLGLLLGGSMLGAGPGGPRASAATLPPAHRPVLRPPKKHKVGDGGTLVNPTPYYLQASTELSEDYFLTSSVPVFPAKGDKVLPFLSDAGQVEAFVLASGKLNHLHRDPTASSGWTYTNIAMPFTNAVVDAAVAGGSKGVVSLIAVEESAGTATNVAFFEQSGANWNAVGGVNEIQGLAGPMKMGVGADGLPYWYTWTRDIVGAEVVYQFILGGGPFSTTASQRVLSIGNPASQALTVENAFLAYNSDWAGHPDQGALLVLTSDGTLSTYDQTSASTFDPTPNTTASAATLIWAGISADPTQVNPDYVYQDPTGAVNFFGSSGISALDATYRQNVGDGQVAVWVDDNGLYTFVFLDSDTRANIVAQYGDPHAAQFTDSIPMAIGLEEVYSLPSDPTQATLFAVDLDDTLNVLTKSPTTGWTQVPVHQDAATVEKVPSWRVQIDVLDANGAPVALGKVQIATDRPVGVWQPATTTTANAGNTVLTPSETITMTASLKGKVSFSIPSTDMDTAQLSVQALDTTGAASGAPFAVTPDIDVHNYLAGTGSLPDLGTISPTDLLNAKGADGKTALFPLLTNIKDPSDQQAGATAVLQAMSHLVGIARGAVPGPNDPKSALLDLSSGVPTFQTSMSATGLDRLGSVGSISSWWDSAKHDAESAYHGIRKGAVEFKHLTVSFGDDIGQWTHDVGVDIGDGLDNVASYIAKDIRTAWHAISGFFKALGADVVDFVNWAMHGVLKLLKNTEANAKVLEGWLDQGVGTLATNDAPATTGELTAQINKLEHWEQGFFTGLETTVTNEINALISQFSHQTIGQAAPLPAPSGGSGSGTGGGVKDAGDIMNAITSTPASWLIDKIDAYLPAGDKGPAPVAAFTQVVTDIGKAFVGLDTELHDIFTTLLAAAQASFSDKDHFTQTQFATILTDFRKTVDDAITVLEAIANTVLDAIKAAIAELAGLLAYEFELVPFIGQLLELAGVTDTTMSVKHLMSLIVMFPTTFVHGLMSSDPLFPSETDDIARLGDSDGDPWAAGIGMTCAVVQTIWALNDMAVDAAKVNGVDAPGFCDYIDIAAPIIQTILGWPGDPDSNNKTQPPFVGNFPTGKLSQLLPWMILTSVIPPAASILFKLLGDPDAKERRDEDSFAGWYSPFILGVSGGANTILSSIYAWGTDATGDVKAEGILGNLSYVFAFLATQTLAEWSDGWSLPALVVIDTIGNSCAGLCMAEDGGNEYPE